MGFDSSKGGGMRADEGDLISLHEATAVAHRLVVGRTKNPTVRNVLDETRGQIAMALAAMAQILARDGGGLRQVDIAEVERRVRASGRHVRPDLSSFYVRRPDLLRAIRALRDAKDASPIQLGNPR